MNNVRNKEKSADYNRPALIAAAARFSVFVHAIAFVVGGLALFVINLLLSLMVDGRWLLAEPMAWWGAALLLHAVAVALAPEVTRLRGRFSGLESASAR